MLIKIICDTIRLNIKPVVGAPVLAWHDNDRSFSTGILLEMNTDKYYVLVDNDIIKYEHALKLVVAHDAKIERPINYEEGVQ